MSTATMQMQTAPIDGLKIRYADSGGPRPGHPAHQPLARKLARVPPRLAGPGPDGTPGRTRPARVWSLEGRADLFTPSAMGEFLAPVHRQARARPPHLVAPDVGASAALFLAARHPGAVPSLVVGGGAQPPAGGDGNARGHHRGTGHRGVRGPGLRATLGATVEPVAPRGQEPDVWEDYVSAYENGRFAQSTRTSAATPSSFHCFVTCCPRVHVPVRVFGATDDPLVPLSNGPLPR